MKNFVRLVITLPEHPDNMKALQLIEAAAMCSVHPMVTGSEGAHIHLYRFQIMEYSYAPPIQPEEIKPTKRSKKKNNKH